MLKKGIRRIERLSQIFLTQEFVHFTVGEEIQLTLSALCPQKMILEWKTEENVKKFSVSYFLDNTAPTSNFKYLEQVKNCK